MNWSIEVGDDFVTYANRSKTEKQEGQNNKETTKESNPPGGWGSGVRLVSLEVRGHSESIGTDESCKIKASYQQQALRFLLQNKIRVSVMFNSSKWQ